jgi:hypothetical protein
MARPSKATTGAVLGMITVLGEAPRAEDGRRRVLCRCECGVEKVMDPRVISNKVVASCGCSIRAGIRAHHAAKRRELQDLGFGVHLVPLTKGKEALIDSENADLVGAWDWHTVKSKSGDLHYAARHDRATGRMVYMHRLIMGEPDSHVDHRNSDGLDNRRENLREATPTLNGANMRIPAHNTSGYKGVGFHKQTGKWRAYIKVDQLYIHLGLHATPEAAHDAYVAAAEKHFGAFARAK